jgi:hypothetical protein
LPRGAISPLVPVLVPLVVAAILVGLAFSWLFPFTARQENPPAVRFTDVTADAGLAFVHDSGASVDEATPTTLSGAVAFLDYDNEGRPDLFFVCGTSWPWKPSSIGGPPTCALYHNDGGGRFTDVTRESGLDVTMLGMGVAVGDYDGDGLPDIFVTGIGGNRLFHNKGNGRFADVTDAAGVRGDAHVWSTGAVWLDIFGEGRLDLVVCNYARWSREADLEGAFAAQSAGPSYTAPAGFVSVFPSVYRNLGTGGSPRSRRRPGSTGSTGRRASRGPSPWRSPPSTRTGTGGSTCSSPTRPGTTSCSLTRATGPFANGPPRRGSGGRGPPPALSVRVRSRSRGRARRPAASACCGPPASSWPPHPTRADPSAACRGKLGVALLDYDLDGRVDFVTGNGLAEPGLGRVEHGRSLAAAPALLWNSGSGWVRAPMPSGAGALGGPLVARGVAVADVEGNGNLDIVIAQNGGPPRLFRNDQRLRHSWLRIDLVGTRCQRDAGGARVEVHTPRGVLVQTMEPAMGFMAQSEKTLTFGLGEDDRVRTVVVRWPDGLRQEIRPPGVNRRLVITEPR